jgi:hypothetical protein
VFPDANAAPNFDIINLPPLPSLNDEEIAALLEDSTNEEGDEVNSAEDSSEQVAGEEVQQNAEQKEQQEILPAPAQEQIRASSYPRRNRAPPQRLGEMYHHGYKATWTDDAMTLAEVQNRPDWPSWKAAMDVELKALQDLGTLTPTQ